LVYFRDNLPKPRIKCNIQADGDKVYHLPGDKFYAVTKIDKTKGEFYAWTETEALENGFRRTKVK
jgi:micrococcal nuclease